MKEFLEQYVEAVKSNKYHRGPYAHLMKADELEVSLNLTQ